MTQKTSILAVLVVILSAVAVLGTANAAPSMSQTKAYIIEKTASSWKKKRNGLLITQSVTFPSKCEMRITHRYESLKQPGRLFVDEVATVPIKEVYKLVGALGGISLRTKAKDIIRQNTYYPAERKHKKICKGSTEACKAKPFTKNRFYLDVIAPQDLYQQKVGKALKRLMELCGAGKEELF